jgi:hypothetical protein
MTSDTHFAGQRAEQTMAMPFESNVIENVEKFFKVITFRVPVGYEDETGFHYGVAKAQPYLI